MPAALQMRVIQMLRQGNSQVFKKYSQMKLEMKREALDKINRRANEMSGILTHKVLMTWVLTKF